MKQYKPSYYPLIILLSLLANPVFVNAQTDAWSRKSSLPGIERDWAFSFSVNGKGYVGAGYDGTTLLNDFWEYNPATDTWTRKSNSPFYRSGGIGFSIDSMGYAGSATSIRDFWRYNPLVNSWSRMVDLPGLERYGKPIGISAGGFGFFGLGLDTSNQPLRDFWMYNPDSNIWQRKADFPTNFTVAAVAFSIGNKIFVGTGLNPINDNKTNEFWEYDLPTNSWTQKVSVGFDGRWGGVGFSINGKGYVGMGYVDNTGISNDFWAYNPTTNSWDLAASCNIDAYTTFTPVGFNIGNRGYIGTGMNFGGNRQKDFFEYSLHTSVFTPHKNNQILIYPNPNMGSFTLRSEKEICAFEVSDISGRILIHQSVLTKSDTEHIQLNLAPGIYILHTEDKNQLRTSMMLTITN